MQAINDLGCGEGMKGMAQTEATFDTVWNAFRALSPEARDRFVERLVADTALREELEDVMDVQMATERLEELEDVMDVQMATERLDEPVRPLDDVLDELGKT